MADSGNPWQEEAIRHVSGPMQVLAGPGSGKTFTIVRRVQYLIEQSHASPSRILVITFTRAAAMEMRQRFHSLTGCRYPAVVFGTFHSFFYTILRQSVPGGFRLLTEKEKYQIITGLWKEIHADEQDARNLDSENLHRLLSQISRRKNWTAPDDSCGVSPSFTPDGFDAVGFGLLYERYDYLLRQEGAMDYDDILLRCEELFRVRPELLKQWRERLDYILIDEFQDINPLQYELVRLLAEPRKNLFIVGDDDQSIYGFRGARPDIMQRFLMDYPEGRQICLAVNYRSCAAIVETSLSCISENQNRLPKAIKAHRKENGTVRFLAFESREEQYDYLVNELGRLFMDSSKKRSPVNPCDCAVIYRTNAEAVLLAGRLAKARIPFLMKEPAKTMYDHFAVQDILSYLLFAATRERKYLFRVMNRPLRYMNRAAAPKACVTLGQMENYYHDRPGMVNTVHKFWADCERIAAMRPFPAVNYVRKGMGYDRYLREQLMTDKVNESEWREWMNVADALQQEAREYADLEQWLNHIRAFREAVQAGDEQRNQAHTGQENAVSLLTMHGSKGLEYENVWLPDVNEGVIPARKATTPEQIEEERRMFYVAMTRARNRLEILYDGGTKENPRVPSRFINKFLS